LVIVLRRMSPNVAQTHRGTVILGPDWLETCRTHDGENDPQKKSISVAAVGVPSVEMAIEKLVRAVTCIVRCLAVVFQPVTKQGPAG
jgi:hypothetical protein